MKRVKKKKLCKKYHYNLFRNSWISWIHKSKLLNKLLEVNNLFLKLSPGNFRGHSQKCYVWCNKKNIWKYASCNCISQLWISVNYTQSVVSSKISKIFSTGKIIFLALNGIFKWWLLKIINCQSFIYKLSVCNFIQYNNYKY